MNMKRKSHYRLLFAWITSLVSLGAVADVPSGYYDAAVGKSGEALQSSLSSILNEAGSFTYKELWTAYQSTDKRADGKVWDMYSSITNYTFVTNQCGNISSEGDCYNREHSVPASWFSDASPMYTDIWHVYPTDGKINGNRGNYPFGEVGSSASSSQNGFSKWGTCVTTGYTGTVFEPNDEYKGDFARAYFYFATRYKNTISGWGGIFITSYPHIVEWQLNMLLRWHELDPVSQKELDRNEAVYESEQGNRNPYIDYPELVDLVFGDLRSQPFNPGESADIPYLEEPIDGAVIDLGTVSSNLLVEATASLTVKGSNIDSDILLTIEGVDASCFSVTPQTLTANEVNNGVTVTLSYYTEAVGTHNATLTLSGGGLSSTCTINLSGETVDDFVALEAKEITQNSFVASWTPKASATDYELNVWYDDYSSSSPEKEILDVTFTTQPADWDYSGYTGIDNGRLRLGSGSNAGSATTPALDLSGDNVLITIKAEPYNSDNSVLYVLVDDEEVGQIELNNGVVTTTLPVAAGTASSKITLKTVTKKLRVCLHSMQVTSGGGFVATTLPGYPCKVGNVTQYTVTDLTPGVQYNYTVTPYVETVAQTVSNTIQVTTGSASIDEVENDHILIYTSGNTLYIINAPANAVASWYTIDGRLCGSRLLYAEENEWELPEGIYIVRVVSSIMQSTQRVYSVSH